MIKLFKRIKKHEVIKKITTVFAASILFILFASFYVVGLLQGYNYGKFESNKEFLSILSNIEEKKKASSFTPTPTKMPVKENTNTDTVYLDVGWGGPELWEAVNNKRQDYGVNPLSARSELCTIASIRLNQLLSLGTLDGRGVQQHAGR